MVLTKAQLHKLNQFMVERGEPVMQGYSGYNKVHYWQMYQLSLLPDLSDLQAYAVASTLSHYTNTQMKKRKDDVNDTVKYYKRIRRTGKRERKSCKCSRYKHCMRVAIRNNSAS